MSRRRQRRRGLSYLPSGPRRTPAIIYIVLAALFFGGIFYAKQGMVKTVSGHILDAYSNQPISDTVKVNLINNGTEAQAAGVAAAQETTTDAQGRFTFTHVTANYQISAETAHYRPVNQNFSNTISPTVKLAPVFLKGVVHNAAGLPVAHANVTMQTASGIVNTVETGAAGDFIFGDVPASGDLTVKAIGYSRSVVHFDHTTQADVTLTPFQANGVYLSNTACNDTYITTNVFNLLDSNAINTVVLNVKDENGYTSYNSSVQFSTPAPSGKGINNLADLIKQLHQHHAYIIGRVVLFQDPTLTDKKPDWTLHSLKTGGLWADSAGFNWINPYNQDSWKFYLGLAKEAATMGFDEIQFDYDRFPALGDLTDIKYNQPSDQTSRLAATAGFLKAAQEQLTPLGVFVSVTALGLTTVEPQDDLGLGQSLQNYAKVADYVSVTLFPQEWGKGAFNLDVPAQHPFEMVGAALHDSLQYMVNQHAQMRPWLEAFNPDKLNYGPSEIKGEIQATGGENAPGGWLLWNPQGQYDPADFQAKAAQSTTSPIAPNPITSSAGAK